MKENPVFPPLNDFTRPILDHLKRHPKRVVFPEGEDVRLLHVAQRCVEEEAIVPILLGRKEIIKRMAEREGISLKFVRIIEPEKSSDFNLFCERYERAEAMKGNKIDNVKRVMTDPMKFASMMALYGQADAVVAGNRLGAAPVFRAVMKYRKHTELNKPLFSISVLVIEEFKKYGGDGIFFMADTGVTPVPAVEDMAYYAVETGKLARHVLGHPVQVSMLSASTNSSVPGIPSDRVRAATTLARQLLTNECLNADILVEGDIQMDAAISPCAYNVRVQHSLLRRSSDVLIFPTLDAADICKKALQLMPGVTGYGLILEDIIFPIAQVPRLSNEETLFGTSLIVALQAVHFHQLYPQGVAPIY